MPTLPSQSPSFSEFISLPLSQQTQGPLSQSAQAPVNVSTDPITTTAAPVADSNTNTSNNNNKSTSHLRSTAEAGSSPQRPDQHSLNTTDDDSNIDSSLADMSSTANNRNPGPPPADWTTGNSSGNVNWNQSNASHNHYSQPIKVYEHAVNSFAAGPTEQAHRPYANLARNGSGRELRHSVSGEEAPAKLAGGEIKTEGGQLNELSMEDDEDDDDHDQLDDGDFNPDEVDGSSKKKRSNKRKISQTTAANNSNPYDIGTHSADAQGDQDASSSNAPTPAKRGRNASSTPGAGGKDGPLLGPADPIQPRNYNKPSLTSRKAIPKAFARTTKGRRATQTLEMQQDANEEGDVELPDTIKDAIDIRRQQNTLAARESRRRKKEHLETLETRVREQDDIIARLEADLRDANDRNAQLERELLEFRIGGVTGGALPIPPNSELGGLDPAISGENKQS